MRKTRTAIAALSIAGAALLAPSIAGADPWVDVTTNGTPVADGQTGALGQQLLITGTGCANLDGNAKMGEFVSDVGHPDSVAPSERWQIELDLDSSGSFNWDLAIPLNNGQGTFWAQWYCSTGPVTQLEDPAVQWASPAMSMTISDPGASQLQMARSLKKGTTSNRSMPTMAVSSRTARWAARSTAVRQSVRSNAPEAVTIHVDQDALPLVDKVNIPGKQAAALKARVDQRVQRDELIRQQLVRALRAFPRLAAQFDHPTTNTDYVEAANLELTGRPASRQAVQASVARLDKHQLKVQVVEDIALTRHDAGWWTRNA